MPRISFPELAIILVIALLVIGPGRLPGIASGLGKKIREFRRAAPDVPESVELDAPLAAAVAAPVVAAPVVAASAPNTLAAAPTPDELGAPATPDPAATAIEAAMEAGV